MTEEEKYTTLDTEQCKWWVNNLFGMAKEKACNSHNFDDGEEIQSAQDKIIKTLEIVEEFERAQVITGGRLNGRAYAYKCGLEDGKRKALEQQPSEDCVSRAELLKKYEDRFIELQRAHQQDKQLGVNWCINTLKHMPPVTPTRKVGKWIRKPIRNDKGGCIGAEMICSCCNKDNRHDEYMDYCPNCGAEMRDTDNG